MQPLASSLPIIAPELILTGGALTLLMLGSWLGNRSLKLLTWLGVGLYAAAALSLIDDTSRAFAFDGLYVSDRCQNFTKKEPAVSRGPNSAHAFSLFELEPHADRDHRLRVLDIQRSGEQLVVERDIVRLAIGVFAVGLPAGIDLPSDPAL